YQHLQFSLRPKLTRVVNAAGIILNTGLGRSPLCAQAQQALDNISRGFSSLEYDLPTGKRGDRHQLVEELLIQLTGAEAAAVVNNNAAATFLVLNTLSQRKETIISRGELITIGGSFRIPDIMQKSGAIMREIGTTNHTQSWEYEQAINEDTGILMKVHTSNYKITGFVAECTLPELVTIGKKHQIPVVHDLGSGMLVDLSQYGLPKEPVVSDSVKAGADIVTFSGDKLVGGPQAGIIVGRKKMIDEIKKNQLSRTMRCGKLTFAALEATLRLFFDREKLLAEHPTLRMMLLTAAVLKRNAMKLKRGLEKAIGDRGVVIIEAGFSEVGGGSLATESLPTTLVKIKVDTLSAGNLAQKLRLNTIPIITRIEKEHVVFDVRTLFYDEYNIIIGSLKSIIENLGDK
ncbi:MAG: L-seryl-tRNA(Sec) selenium transferase, partial [bacterium]|nr:L-seryl-tRNA(Sec) selenium transferase [bacterium]